MLTTSTRPTNATQPLSLSWQQDYQDRMNPTLVTRLLRQSVPVLQATDWKISVVDEGFSETVLPLNHASTNQHGTHQAALISLSADYTGGVALASLLRGIPIAGIHPCQPGTGASLWLAAMDVKYVRPSTGHLIGRCRVPAEAVEKISGRYAKGKRVLVSLPVTFESNGEVVATAKMKYFCQSSEQLVAQGAGDSPLAAAKLKASARMIAGVRATSQFANPVAALKPPACEPGSDTWERVDQSHAALAAGPHGVLLAEKLKRALPQLSNMVMARTKHADETTRSINQLRQIVLVGAGLDMRPTNYATATPAVTCFEIDLPDMLTERERVFGLLDAYSGQPPAQQSCERVTIAADFTRDDVGQLLTACPQFDPTQPTAFIYEGCSMYFDEPINRRVIEGIASQMQHADSRLWVDFVSRDAVDRRVPAGPVHDFLDRMHAMGEEFTFGVDNPQHLLSSCGLSPEQVESTLDAFDLEDATDAAVYELYWFTCSSR